MTALEPGTYEIRLATDDDEVRGTVTVEAAETPTETSETDVPVSNAQVNGGSQSACSPPQQPPALSKIFEFPYSAYAVGVFVVVMWLRYLNR